MTASEEAGARHGAAPCPPSLLRWQAGGSCCPIICVYFSVYVRTVLLNDEHGVRGGPGRAAGPSWDHSWNKSKRKS